MQRIFNLLATALAAFQDLAVGMFITTAFIWATGEPNLWWLLLILLIVFILVWGFGWGLLPDFDLYLPMRIRRWIHSDDVAHHHESGLHWPLVVLSIVFVGSLLLWIILGQFGLGRWGFVLGASAFLSVLAHYLHDGAMMGWPEGAEWFFRLKRAHWTAMPGRIEPSDPDHEHWMNRNWFKPSLLSVTEIMIGSTALGIALAIVSHSITNGLLLMYLIWIGVISFWQACEANQIKYQEPQH